MGSACWVLCSVLGAECWVLGAARSVLGDGCWVTGAGPDAECAGARGSPARIGSGGVLSYGGRCARKTFCELALFSRSGVHGDPHALKPGNAVCVATKKKQKSPDSRAPVRWLFSSLFVF